MQYYHLVGKYACWGSEIIRLTSHITQVEKKYPCSEVSIRYRILSGDATVDSTCNFRGSETHTDVRSRVWEVD